MSPSHHRSPHAPLLPYWCIWCSRDESALRDQARAQAAVPLTSSKSQQLLADADLPSDFLTRQAYLSALAQEKKALYRSLLEEATCTFQPALAQRAARCAQGRARMEAPMAKQGGTCGELSHGML